MSPSVFAYIILITLLLAGAAAAVEWGTQGRIATRHAWTMAIVFAMMAPPAVLLWHAMAHHARTADWSVTPDASTRTFAPQTPSHESLRNNISSGIGVASIRAIVPRHVGARVMLVRIGARFSAVATTVWVALSLALLRWLAAGVAYWRRIRKSWEHTTMDGMHVDVSPLTGPAVLGLLSQRIVLPSWATTMQPERLRLVLAHEREHISAHDPQRLAVAMAALIVMPWNIALWWCAARLRRAIELDCDARVLRRFPDTKEYGYVLLEVAAKGRTTRPFAVPMVGLLNLPSELELRLRAMTRPRSASARMIAGGGIIACAAIGAAFTAPVPSMRNGRALTMGKSVARAVASPILSLAQRSESPDRAQLPRSQQLDSVNVLINAMREQTLRLAAAQSDLAIARNALLAAEGRVSPSETPQRRMAALRAEVRGLVVANERTVGPTRQPASDRREVSAEMNGLKPQIDRAMTSYYPEILAHPEKGAIIWFVADRTGRVFRTMRDAAPSRALPAIHDLRTAFPDVNPIAVKSITRIDKVAGRSNLSVTWVRLGEDPSTFFKTHQVNGAR